MSVTPTGIFSVPIDTLATMISQSATFQSVTASASAAAAKQHVYVSAVSASGTGAFTRPYALVSIPEGFRIMQENYGTGELLILFEFAVAEGNLASYSDATYAFTNPIGAIVDELFANRGDNSLYLRELVTVSPPQRNDLNEDSQYFQVVLKVYYGAN
jgi:hypothetical protein